MIHLYIQMKEFIIQVDNMEIIFTILVTILIIVTAILSIILIVIKRAEEQLFEYQREYEDKE